MILNPEQIDEIQRRNSLGLVPSLDIANLVETCATLLATRSELLEALDQAGNEVGVLSKGYEDVQNVVKHLIWQQGGQVSLDRANNPIVHGLELSFDSVPNTEQIMFFTRTPEGAVMGLAHE